MFVLRKRYKDIENKLYLNEVERKEMAICLKQIIGGLTKILERNKKREIGNVRAISEMETILDGCLQYIARKAKAHREPDAD